MGKGRKLLSISVAMFGLGLSGCATSEDPADGGFFNGISGLSEGTYQNRIDQREAELSSAQQANQRLASLQRQQNAEQARVSSDLRAVQASYNAVSSEIDVLSRRLANIQASGSNVSNQASQLSALQSRRTALAAGGVTAAEAAEVQRLDAATDALRRAIDAAFGAGVGL